MQLMQLMQLIQQWAEELLLHQQQTTPNIKVKPFKKTRLAHANAAKSEWMRVNHEQQEKQVEPNHDLVEEKN
jgi:hypothetical protein